MKLINTKLFIEFTEMVNLGVSDGYLKKAKSVGSASWEFIKDPADNRRVLIGYEALGDKYKKLVFEAYGDPYEYLAKNPILNLVRKDFKAEQFFQDHKLPDGRILEPQYIYTYTKDASWLNMIIRVTKNKQAFKAEVPGVSMNAFWETVCDLIRADKETSLPATRRNLLPIIEKYKANGPLALISPKFGNKNSAKIGKTANGYSDEVAEKQIKVIRRLLSKHNNFDNAQIANLVNILFTKNNLTPVTTNKVGEIRAKYSHIIKAGNSGLRAHNNTVAKQVKRAAPEYPLAMVTVDGWTAELLYQERREKNGKTHVDYNGRMVVVVVLDPFMKYPVGYAIGERENTELIREANRNAIKHIYELFGDAFRPWQVQSDRYGLKQLTPFYEAMSKIFTPAAVGNAKSKVIEPYFKYLNKEYCQYDDFWSGFNVNSKKGNQPNTEYLDKIKHQMPEKAGVIAKIERIIEIERAKKQAQYLAKWNDLAPHDYCQLGVEHYLQVFGRQTLKPSHQISGDLRPQIGGKTYHFETFDANFLALNHLAWNIHYDSDSMSEVLAVSEDGKYRFLLKQKVNVPMALRDAQPEHFEYRSRVRDYNKQLERNIIETYADDALILQEMISGTPLSLDDHQEAALKLMFTTGGQQKEAIQDAKKLGKRKPKELAPAASTTWQAEHIAYLNTKVDFNQYKD